MIGLPVDDGDYHAIPVALLDTGASGEPLEEIVDIFISNPVLGEVDYVELPLLLNPYATLTGLLQIGEGVTDENKSGWGVDISPRDCGS